MNDMSRHVFTYGSLMFAEVWQTVVRGRYRSEVVTLPGHARYAIDGESYPAVVPQAGASVEGRLYFDVMPDDLQRLDVFEGSDYRRGPVRVRAPGGEIAADTYIYLDASRLLPQPWSAQAFDLSRFMATYCGFN